MDQIKIEGELLTLRDQVERLQSLAGSASNRAEGWQETSEMAPPADRAAPDIEELKTLEMTARIKTFRIDQRKRANNGESREGYITITSSGNYEGMVNFRCNCHSFLCACNFDSARVELRDASNTTVTSISFNPDRFDLAKASDTNIKCSGWSRLIAEAFDRIMFADPMFRSN